jgi:two-component system chemotaxis response regulator CheY
MKVLLVDDSRAMRVILKNQLSMLGVKEFVEAEDGRDALAKLTENMPVDLVALDVNMPVMDGMQCLKAIRAKKEFDGVKVVMVTSEAEKSKIIEAISSGANNYIVKPFTPETIKQKLGIG